MFGFYTSTSLLYEFGCKLEGSQNPFNPGKSFSSRRTFEIKLKFRKNLVYPYNFVFIEMTKIIQSYLLDWFEAKINLNEKVI